MGDNKVFTETINQKELKNFDHKSLIKMEKADFKKIGKKTLEINFFKTRYFSLMQILAPISGTKSQITNQTLFA